MSDEAAAVWVPIERLGAWDRNPRLISDENVARVAESIRRFGFGAPLVAREQDGELIAGHTRLRAAMKLGLDKVPVRFLRLDPAEAHLLALADNRLTELTPWNEPELHSLLGDYDATSAGLAGWNAEDLEALETRLLADDEQRDVNPENDVVPDEIPEPPKDPVTRPGDLWVLGQHRLLCGDCRSADDLARLFEGSQVHVAVTSPPYASQRKYDESSGFKPIAPDEYVAWFEAVQRNVGEVLAPGGSWFVNIKEHCEDGQRHLYVKDLVTAHVRRWGWFFIDEFVWVRQGVPGGWANRFKNGFEPIFHFSRGAQIKFRPEHVLRHSEYAFQYEPGKAKKNAADSGFFRGDSVGAGEGMARPNNVLHLQTNSQNTGFGGHGASYPIGLPSFFLRAFSDVGDACFDPFMGSGTTLIAAEKLERMAYGTEISPAYCDVIVERWEALGQGKAQRFSAG